MGDSVWLPPEDPELLLPAGLDSLLSPVPFSDPPGVLRLSPLRSHTGAASWSPSPLRGENSSFELLPELSQ